MVANATGDPLCEAAACLAVLGYGGVLLLCILGGGLGPRLSHRSVLC